MSDYERLRAAVTRLLDAVRTEPTMGGQLRNPGITDRRAFCEAMREVLGLLATPPSAPSATCMKCNHLDSSHSDRGCVVCSCPGMAVRVPDRAPASVATARVREVAAAQGLTVKTVREVAAGLATARGDDKRMTLTEMRAEGGPKLRAFIDAECTKDESPADAKAATCDPIGLCGKCGAVWPNGARACVVCEGGGRNAPSQDEN
jgi:hypothetical protein